MNWIASLPMYNVTPSLEARWREWLADVLRAVEPRAQIGSAGDDLEAFWRRRDLLLSQTCGYPLMNGLREHVQLIATPCFDAPGCDGADYSSVLVTRADAPFDTLERCRGARAAFNQNDSNSGFNAFRHAVAPLAHRGTFFGATLCTGSHAGSLQAIAENRADVAAIDCVTMAFVRDERPTLARNIKEIGWTSASPGLPLIASNDVPAETVLALRSALNDALAARPERARHLHLKGFSTLSMADYARITQLESEAVALGYPHLA
ncbi:MAG TPA: PhnD/SsuA/transferrin family substrate-binding protein [Paraburkholderia sp.]